MTTSPTTTDNGELVSPGSGPRWPAWQETLDGLAFALTMGLALVQTFALPLTRQPPGGLPPLVVGGIALGASMWVAVRASDLVTMALAELRLSGVKGQLVRSAVLVVLTWAVFNQGHYSVPLRSAAGVCLVAVAAAAVVAGLATAGHRRREAAGVQA